MVSISNKKKINNAMNDEYGKKVQIELYVLVGIRR